MSSPSPLQALTVVSLMMLPLACKSTGASVVKDDESAGTGSPAAGPDAPTDGDAAEAGCSGHGVNGLTLPADALTMPIRHQPNGYLCGPTSLATVLAFWQVQYINQVNLAPSLGTTPDAGTDPWRIRDYAISQGLAAEVRGQVSSALPTSFASKIGAPLNDATTDDLRHAVCAGAYHTADCQPVGVILDLQAWGTGDGKILNGNVHYTSNYATEWEDGHYVVVAGIDPDDSGYIYLMDPDSTDQPSDKAYSAIPISAQGIGLLTRWHDYVGTNPNANAGGAPPSKQQWLHGAIFISAGSTGTQRTTFESLVPTLQLSKRKPDASPADTCLLKTGIITTY